ncbi:MAG: sensor histidine kinase, partial [Verrucomicrobiota bacterium]
LLRPLDDWRGETIAMLRIVRETPALAQRLRSEALATRIFVIFGLCLVVTLGLSLQLWVLRPLGQIGDSLARHDTTPIRDLRHEHTELARVARLVESSFEQRAQLRQEIAERTAAELALQRTLEERARLGRDLHDGVIQSIYAAGMGLAAAQSQLKAKPVEASVRVEEVRAVLNDTIRDVRNFITGLEPEALQRSTFATAVDKLLATVRTANHDLQTNLDIDESLTDLLPMAVRTEALQIIREAVSNAVRHGDADTIDIHLRRENGRASLLIADNGTGFDPATVRRGRGLDNIAERIRLLGANIDFQSSPGNGTRVQARFNLNES